MTYDDFANFYIKIYLRDCQEEKRCERYAMQCCHVAMLPCCHVAMLPCCHVMFIYQVIYVFRNDNERATKYRIIVDFILYRK